DLQAQTGQESNQWRHVILKELLDKVAYRAPTRGAQGNAWKTLVGIAVALGQERSRAIIETANVRHDSQVWASPAGEVLCQHRPTPTEAATCGTRITVTIPGSVKCYYWNLARWATAYALLNPHARLRIREIGPVPTPDDENERPKSGATTIPIQVLRFR
ncbi:MAG: hypothetical protein RKP73_04905, partial [Candidatus Contendobacter sp.]|nr:hypothetical protein [Candidatus Contendobacter sp.]